MFDCENSDEVILIIKCVIGMWDRNTGQIIIDRQAAPLVVYSFYYVKKK